MFIIRKLNKFFCKLRVIRGWTHSHTHFGHAEPCVDLMPPLGSNPLSKQTLPLRTCLGKMVKSSAGDAEVSSSTYLTPSSETVRTAIISLRSQAIGLGHHRVSQVYPGAPLPRCSSINDHLTSKLIPETLPRRRPMGNRRGPWPLHLWSVNPAVPFQRVSHSELFQDPQLSFSNIIVGLIVKDFIIHLKMFDLKTSP